MPPTPARGEPTAGSGVNDENAPPSTCRVAATSLCSSSLTPVRQAIDTGFAERSSRRTQLFARVQAQRRSLGRTPLVPLDMSRASPSPSTRAPSPSAVTGAVPDTPVGTTHAASPDRLSPRNSSVSTLNVSTPSAMHESTAVDENDDRAPVDSALLDRVMFGRIAHGVWGEMYTQDALDCRANGDVMRPLLSYDAVSVLFDACSHVAAACVERAERRRAAPGTSSPPRDRCMYNVVDLRSPVTPARTVDGGDVARDDTAGDDYSDDDDDDDDDEHATADDDAERDAAWGGPDGLYSIIYRDRVSRAERVATCMEMARAARVARTSAATLRRRIRTTLFDCGFPVSTARRAACRTGACDDDADDTGDDVDAADDASADDIVEDFVVVRRGPHALARLRAAGVAVPATAPVARLVPLSTLEVVAPRPGADALTRRRLASERATELVRARLPRRLPHDQ